MKAIIKSYKSLFGGINYQTKEHYKFISGIMPYEFTITEEVPEKIPADFYLIAKDFNGEELRTGLREFYCKDILYGDRLEKNGQKSLMILIKFHDAKIELHFFPRFYPERNDRTNFMIDYLRERGLIN